MDKKIIDEIAGLFKRAEKIPQLNDSFLKLSEYGNIVLVGTKLFNGDYEYYVWKKIGDKFMQSFGSRDFSHAKRKFLRQSGLQKNLDPFDVYEYNLLDIR